MNILPLHIINLKNKETHICSNLTIGLKKQRKRDRVIPISFIFGERFPEPARAAGGTAPQPRIPPCTHPRTAAGGRPPPAPSASSWATGAPGSSGLSSWPAHARGGTRRAGMRTAPGCREPAPSLAPPGPDPADGRKLPVPSAARRCSARRSRSERRSRAAPHHARRRAPRAARPGTARLGPAPGPSSAPARRPGRPRPARPPEEPPRRGPRPEHPRGLQRGAGRGGTGPPRR